MLSKELWYYLETSESLNNQLKESSRDRYKPAFSPKSAFLPTARAQWKSKSSSVSFKAKNEMLVATAPESFNHSLYSINVDTLSLFPFVLFLSFLTETIWSFISNHLVCLRNEPEIETWDCFSGSVYVCVGGHICVSSCWCLIKLMWNALWAKGSSFSFTHLMLRR